VRPPLLALASLLLPPLAGCPVDPPSLADDGDCGSWVSASEAAALDGERLSELSGLAASHRYPDVLWAINDQGHAPIVVAVDRDGEARGSFSLPGIDAVDWEDLAVGPCPEGAGTCSCLYVADTGDNERQRDTGRILRFPEPALPDEGSAEGVATGVESLWFSYPGDRHDAEALLVGPATGEIVVVTKAQAGADTVVYAFADALPGPTTEDAPTVLQEVARLDLEAVDGLDSPRITAGDVSPRCLRALLATDEDLLLYDLSAADGLGPAFIGSPLRLGLDAGASVEGATFALDGASILVAGESEQPSLWEARCASFTSSGDASPDPLVVCGAG